MPSKCIYIKVIILEYLFTKELTDISNIFNSNEINNAVNAENEFVM